MGRKAVSSTTTYIHTSNGYLSISPLLDLGDGDLN